MSLMKQLPILISMRNIIVLAGAVHIAIFTYSFFESFDWFNRWLVDNSHTDPVIGMWLFWLGESLLVLFLLGRKIKGTTFARG